MSEHAVESTPVTDDAFLGGALHILQPRKGYRAGVDAVLLAAAVPWKPGVPERALDVGAGVGTVGLCLARRCLDIRVVLYEREPALARIARENVRRNRLEDRATVAEGDVGNASAAELAGLGLAAESFDHVLANPPFHVEGDGTRAANGLKAGAHEMAGDGLERWIRFLARMAKPGATATIVHKAEALPELLAALGNRFGALKIVPVHPRDGEPAIRVIVQGIKGSRAPLGLMPGFVLHASGDAPSPAAEAVLRRGAGLALD
jgi:tRNA1(Val) A37 N6-methylase TrmN6